MASFLEVSWCQWEFDTRVFSSCHWGWKIQSLQSESGGKWFRDYRGNTKTIHEKEARRRWPVFIQPIGRYRQKVTYRQLLACIRMTIRPYPVAERVISTAAKRKTRRATLITGSPFKAQTLESERKNVKLGQTRKLVSRLDTNVSQSKSVSKHESTTKK